MAKATTKSATSDDLGQPSEVGLSSEGENIDKIRDILFGSQSRQIEKKLAALEVRMDKEVESLRSEVKTTLETLEQFIRKETQSLSDQLGAERAHRVESEENFAERLADARKVLDKKLTQLSDKAIKDQREIQEQILQQSKNLLEELHQKHDALEKLIAQGIEELRHEKTDRLALANLMMEAAMRLKDEFQLPGTE